MNVRDSRLIIDDEHEHGLGLVIGLLEALLLCAGRYDSGEESLYAPILQMLKNNWQQLFPGFPAPTKHWVDSSPRQGRRMTGGRWTRHLLVRGQAARSVQHPEASRLKVGVATFEDPTAADTWTVHVVPGRHAPEARLLNEFMETLPEPIRKEIEFSI